MTLDYLWMAVVALAWGGYPLLARAAGQQGPAGALLLMIGGLIPVTLAWRILPATATFPKPTPALMLLAAGATMGVGLTAYHAVLTGPMNASVSIPTINVAMLIVSTFGAVLFFAESLSTQQVFAVALLVAGIVLLQRG